MEDMYMDDEQRMKELEKSETIYRLITEATNDGVWYYDAAREEMVASEKWLEMTGYTADEIKTLKDWDILIHPEDRQAANKEYRNHLGGRTPFYNHEYRFRCADGSYKWFGVFGKATYDANGKLTYFAGGHSDINELKNKSDRIKFLAYHDHLTDLPNRACFIEILDEEIKPGAIDPHLAVILLDIDNFKDVNESIGHGNGDDLLRQIADRICGYTAEGNIIFRFGGDEFAIMLRRARSRTETARYCEGLKRIIAEPFKINTFNINMTGTFGIAMYPSDGATTEELLKNAETAMYRAKKTGRNMYQFFEPDMKEQVLKKLRMERKLRKAITDGNLYLCFQPQVELETGKVRSFEALLRWYDDELGQIPPSDFIPIAEETGMIVQIGESVLREACSRAYEWNTIFAGNLLVSVNISVVQLKQKGFLAMVRSVLNETGLTPSLLELEITESIMINSIENALSLFNEIRAMGIKLSMDDFGTGYSSLNYLKKLPLNTLKIDRSFIGDIENESVEKNIIEDIVSLVHKLDVKVIAEGVETAAQLDYLAKCRCDYVQGFLLGRPARAEEIPDIIARDFGKLIF